jgi:Protein of unknown function (DUF2851)
VRVERGECVREEEVARRWWSLPKGSVLLASNGAAYTLLFAGMPGGASGPDVRDAVFSIAYRPLLSVIQPDRFPQTQITGDVEFHVRSRDWVMHGHQKDERYNQVILHVVFASESGHPTYRQDGILVPVYCVRDLMECGQELRKAEWPCQQLIRRLEANEVERRLRLAGEIRFEQKVHALVEALHTRMGVLVESPFSVYDQVLIVALAEGLGYGRDRLFFRAVGSMLVYGKREMPEPLGRAEDPAPLDAMRLRVLGRLVEKWRTEGAWKAFREIMQMEQTEPERLQALRRVLCSSGLSLARTDILICNVILPFAAAIGLIERDLLLYERASALYREHPGLSENWVTRFMCQQLELEESPEGSCQQQGLQHIYQQTCREKHCEKCMLGKRSIL